jgi:hypothetical protein
MGAVVALWDKVQNKLEDQICDRFGDPDAFKSIAWTAKRAAFQYAQVEYLGIRCVLTAKVF